MPLISYENIAGVVTALGLTHLPLVAEELQGADAVLRRLEERANTKPEADKKADPVGELAKKIKAFTKEGLEMPAEKAAFTWLALYDTYVSIPRQLLYEGASSERPSMTGLLQALPPSSAWPALITAIDRRTDAQKALRDSGLRLLAATLHGDGTSRAKAIKAIKQAVAKDSALQDDQRENMDESFEELSNVIEQLAGNNEEQLAAFEKKLAALEKKQDKVHERISRELSVPDLVRMAGKDKALALLQRALLVVTESPVQFTGKATMRLAAHVALSHVSDLKQPPWALVETGEDLPLYESLVRQFPKAAASSEKQSADEVYLVNLIAADRTQEATAFVLKAAAEKYGDSYWALSASSLESLRKRGKGARALAFLHEMLERDSSLPLWETYIEFSAQEGSSSEALSFLHEVLKKTSLTVKAKAEVQSHYANGLLAADHVDEGIAVLREMVKAGPQVGPADGAALVEETKKQWSQLGVQISPEVLKRYRRQAFGMTDSGQEKHVRDCLRLVELGRLLQRPEVIAEGLASAKAGLDSLPREEGSRRALRDEMVGVLLSLKRAAEAEALVVDDLLLFAAPLAQQQRRDYREGVQSLATLAFIYQNEGRPADVVKLLTDSPLWAWTDLSQLSTILSQQMPFPLIAARALASTGHKEDARKIALRMVQDYPGMDACYELLLSFGADGLELQLDEIYKGDRFEERPLIWKAVVQLQQGRVDDAEKTVRAAIAVDPSDGEEGKGDRMRAYAVLGDILEKKGDMDQAKIMRGAVAAIRISENADDWWRAGMLSRSVKMYEEALNHFANAYCIQSRLALRYSELGDAEKAAQHYRRAFELMPESFGRVESHCFGCEKAFAGEKAQNIADKVFSDLAIKLPDRAQIFYLLGYLREEQERFEDAAVQYRKAIALDPDYLNAWKRLEGLELSIDFPQDECQQIVLAQFRIDPMGHHSSPSLDKLNNLDQVWDAILAAERSRPERENGSLYPLPAARAAREKLGGGNVASLEAMPDFFEQREELRSRFVSHPLVRLIAQYLENITAQR